MVGLELEDGLTCLPSREFLEMCSLVIVVVSAYSSFTEKHINVLIY